MEKTQRDSLDMVKRIRSKSGKYVALIPEPPAEGFSVEVTPFGVAAFNACWPCSRLRERRTRFEFAGNGDLVDIVGGKQPDREGLLALSQGAQAFGEKCKQRLTRPAPT